MSKLNEIIFKEVQSKQFDVLGKKVTLRALTTKDNIEMDVNTNAGLETTKDILVFAVKVLSRSITDIDGIKPDNEKEIAEFLQNQESSVVFKLLDSYQSLIALSNEEIKNSVGTSN